MRPRRCFSPLESSPGTSPRYAINAGADANRRKSCNSARISIAVNVSMPRKQRNHPTGSRYGSRLGDLRQPGIQLHAAAPRCDRSPTDSRRRRRARRRASTQAVDPLAVRARPVAARVVQAPPQQQLAQPMPTPLQIFPGIIPRPRQIPHGLVFGRRRLHRRQQPRAPQLHQLARIAAIRLDPLTRLPRNQRRRDHVAAHPRRRHLPLQRVATRAGFIEHAAPAPAPRARASAPGDAPPSARSPAATSPASSAWPISIATNRSFLCASIPTYVVTLFHDRLPSMRLWRLGR